MAVKDMTFLQAAPLNAWVAMDEAETKILFSAPTLRELNNKIRDQGLSGSVVVWKNPPAWAPMAL